VWLDSETDRESAALRMRTALYRAALAASVAYALFVVAAAVGARPGVRLVSGTTLLDALNVTIVLAVAARVRRRARGLAELHVLGFLCAFFGSANAIGSAFVLHDPRELFYLALYILAIGAVALFRVASALAMTAIGIAAVVVASRLGAVTDVAWVAITMLASILVGIAIQLGQREHLAFTASLQADERARRAELATALARLETELVERKRAEDERTLAEAARAEMEARLWQVQKLDALGTLAGGVAHDINNVLGAIVGVAEVARDEAPEGSASHEDFEHILAAAQRGAALTRNLLGFARRGKHRDEAFCVDGVIEEVVALLARTAPKGVTFVAELGTASSFVRGDPAQVSQAIMNLCLNAIEAMAGEGSLQLRSSRVVLGAEDSPTLPAGGRYVSIEVIDDGAGMDANTLAHAFEPFYSSKSSTTHHSGLGLAMIYGTMRDHEGEVLLRSTPSVGTTATLRFPEAEAPASEAEAPDNSATHGTASGPVLIIDDEPAVRRAMRRFLESARIETVEANGGVAGLQLFRAEPRRFSLVLLDLAMPEMSGAVCFGHLRALDPGIPILIVSGYPKDQSVEALLAAGGAEFLSKPFTALEILSAVRRCRRMPGSVAQREA
jgi:signal transduction histidine kinase/CheY-like chemotaxis protein